MNGRQLRRLIAKDPLAKKKFRGVYARDTLPSQPLYGGYIINTDRSLGPGIHWVAAWFSPQHKNEAEYFDSFGLPPWFHKEIETFLLTHTSSYNYNRFVLQDVTSKACGFYVLYYILMKSRGWCLQRIVGRGFEPHKPRANDNRVTNLVHQMLRHSPLLIGQ